MSGTIEKYRNLATRLYQRTLLKGIRWQHNNIGDTVEAKIGSQVVEVKQSMNDDLEFLYIVSINNTAGTYLDGFNDEQIGRGMTVPVGTMSYYNVLENLFELAKRQATGADVALDEILAALDKDEAEESSPF